MSDLAIIGTYLIFLASYVVFALGKFPGMKIDRPGAAIIGAVADSASLDRGFFKRFGFRILRDWGREFFRRFGSRILRADVWKLSVKRPWNFAKLWPAY